MDNLVLLLLSIIVTIVGGSTMMASWMEIHVTGFLLGLLFFLYGCFLVMRWRVVRDDE